MSVLHTYTMKYSILSIFRAKQKMTPRSSRKHCSLLCVSVMKEYLLNFSYIRLKYVLLVFSSRFLLPKLNVFDIWKKELSNFHEILESARARASFENWFCVEFRVTAFTGKKNQVKRLLFRWCGTHFRWTCLCGHEIQEFFKSSFQTQNMLYFEASKIKLKFVASKLKFWDWKVKLSLLQVETLQKCFWTNLESF